MIICFLYDFWRSIINVAYVSGGTLVLFLLFLWAERILLSRKIRRIPLRICVTGTRGKSSVTRLIAGVLRESGMSVLAKTTGSKAVLVFPDGTEKEIVRRGRASLFEGKNVLDKAAKLGVQALVAEMMSIQSETIAAESAQLFRPHVLIITNTRLDHLDLMGKTKEDIAECFASAITDRSAVFIPEQEFFPAYKKRSKRSNSKIFSIPPKAFLNNIEEGQMTSSPFVRDIQLCLAVAEFLGVDGETAQAGMKKARPDFGSLKAWKAETGISSKTCLFINSFAANDPESTKDVLDLLRRREILEGKKRIALLNFRRDRGDRTIQWLKAMQEGFLSDFDRVVLLGDHSPIVKNRLKKTGPSLTEYTAGPAGSPLEIMAATVFQDEENVVVGMGNMAGMGREFVLYWEKIGEPYDL